MREPHAAKEAFHVTANTGVALATAPDCDLETLLANADLALYRAKRPGARRPVIFTDRYRTEHEAERLLDEEPSLAANRDQFGLHYQPQILFADGSLVGAEALLRWRHPTRRLLAPPAFLGALEEDEAMVAALRTLKARGVGIDFDDFGTGFASLTTLRDFPLTRLKIDRGFVAHLPASRHDAATVGAILALAGNLGLTVIAEGVETEAQERFLTSCGCDQGQGYRYGRPLPGAEFLEAAPRYRPYITS